MKMSGAGLGSNRVVASSIEQRLLEMQRKLSEIAEIPKILCSTLATVSETFDKLSTTELEEAYAQRKYSYDEDAYDYELTTQTDDDEDDADYAGHAEDGELQPAEEQNDDDLVQLADDDELKASLKQSKLAKDVTPESDYASETNFASDKPTDEPEDTASSLTSDDDVDDDNEADEQDDDDDDSNAVYYMKLPAAFTATAASCVEHASSTDDDDDDGDNNDDDGNESDFLSTTYTWNLRNVSKMRANDADEHNMYDLTLASPLQHPQQQPASLVNGCPAAPDTSKVRPATPQAEAAINPAPLETESQAQKVLFKLDNFERCWPWADRKKIIYKQSTCHLVRHQPLGLVGQRIQLLAKQNIFNKHNAE